MEVVLGTVGQLWMCGVDVDWLRLQGKSKRKRLSLPSYPFDKERQLGRTESQKPVDLEESTGPQPLERAPSVKDWVYRREWERVRLPTPYQEGDLKRIAGTWLLFSVDSEDETVIANVLRRDGIRLLTVIPGSEFERVDANTYRINPTAEAHYERLVVRLKADGIKVEGALYLVGLY